MKRFAVVGLAALMVLGVVPAASAAGSFADPSGNGIQYSIIDGASVTVEVYMGGPGSVSIPATVDDGGTTYAVTSIADSAFFSAGLTSVTIPEGVTSIADAAFSTNDLTSVTIPASVTTIGKSAFETNSLTSVTIPAGVTSIGEFAFEGNNLASVTISDGVTTIGNSAFQLNHLTSVTIPASVTSIGTNAFDSNILTSVTISDGVTNIGEGAFQFNNLTSVTIPASVISIGPNAFQYNDALTSAQLLGEAPTMGAYALGPFIESLSYFSRYSGYDTPFWSPGGANTYPTQALAQVTYDTTGGSTAPAQTTVAVGGTVTAPADPTWAGHTFAGWFTSATGGTAWNFASPVNADTTLYAQWTVVAGPVSLTDSNGISYAADSGRVGDGASITDYTGSSKVVSIPATVTINGIEYDVISIGANAFDHNALTSVVIPASVTRIGANAFAYNALTSVVIPDGITSIGDYTFYGNRLTSVVIPDGVTSIGANAFAYNALTSVTVPDGVASIGAYAFMFNSLTSVTIPGGVTSIGNYAFQYNSLASVTISDGVTSIGNYAFYSNSLTSVTIPDGVTSIGAYAFGNNGVTSVQLLGAAPATVGTYAFGTNAQLRLSYLQRYGSPAVAGGYTSPTWKGYATQALVQVTYDTTGGSTAPTQATVAVGDTVIATAEPTWAGHTFTGWFTAATGGTAWVFTNPVTTDTTLFAQWDVLAQVTYDTAGGSTAPAPVTVTVGNPVTAPTAPTWAGHAFTGWFTAATGGTAWVFTNPVTTDTTLYAQWTVVTPPVTDPPVVDPPVTDPPVLVPPLVTPSAPAVNLTVDLAVGSPIGNAPVDVSGAGLLANSPWTLVLHSTPTVVASGLTTSTGAFGGTISLPDSIPAGAHALTLSGTAPDGSTVTKVVYLTVTDTGTLDYLSAQGPQLLAATGVDTPVDGLIGWALLMVLLGAALIVVRRRRILR